MWDISFSVASIISALLIGVALGNIVWGIPLNQHRDFVGTFLELLNPYALMVGVTTVALFMMHGAIYLVMKTEGELHNRIRDWIRNTIIFFVIMYFMTTMVTLLFVPHMVTSIKTHPWLFALPVLNLLAVANIPREAYKGRDFRAFISSCAAMAFLLALFGLGIYPNMIYSLPNPELSLTIYNAASSQKTLEIMLIIAALGVPLVLSYTVSIYWIFRGKVKLDASSY
jgi:cytochrome d ubiquinol oxidase subunit II